jgi:hypothetical protein
VADIKGWSDKHQQELGLLTRFLVAISKQQLAHVWLATSDRNVQGWLTQREVAIGVQNCVHPHCHDLAFEPWCDAVVASVKLQGADHHS